jgi:molybdate transport system substrate-binding protein
LGLRAGVVATATSDKKSGRPSLLAGRSRLSTIIGAVLQAAAHYAITAGVLIPLTAGADEIRVLTSGAPAKVQENLAVRFTAETGHRVALTVANPAGIRQRLIAGEPADLVVLPTRTIDQLQQAGTLRIASRVELARVGIGVVVRSGAPLPDVASVDAVRRLLRDARSIVFPDPAGGGQTGVALARMTERLGLADVVNPKLTLRQAIAGGVALVASGAAEVGMFNISEALAVPGVALAGPLPPELQSYLVFTAAIPVGNRAPALAFVRFLTAPDARAAWQAGGLEALPGG